MKKVDVIYGGWLNAPNGASSVIKLLYNNRSLFETNGVSCNFVTNDTYWETPKCRSNDMVLQNKGVKSCIKRVLKALISHSPTLESAISIYLGFMKSSKKIAKRYVEDENPQDKTPLFFHDIFTCYYYLKHTSANRPILLTLHNNGETFKMLSLYFPCINDSWVMRLLNRVEHYTINKVTKICFVANNPCKLFLRNHPEISPDRVHFVYNGLPHIDSCNDVVKNDNLYEICSVGSITSRKGQDIIIKSLSLMKPCERDKIHITFVGDGDKRHRLEEECEKLGFNSIVSFVGNQRNVDEYLMKSDIFLLMSRDEGFPMAILEAERIGLPIISTNVAGIPEMIKHKETGFVINPNSEELADILKEIDKYDWKGMGEKSQSLFNSRFTLGNMIDGYSSILKAL